jgi:RNA polymerase sigma factor (sigma-70 family)
MATAALSAVVGYVRQSVGRDTRRLTDHQLLDRCHRQRDEDAFAELVRRHGPMVLSTCRRVLRHEQDAEDAFQATFLILARKAAAIRQEASGWLYRVAHRLALRARARAARRRERLTPLGEVFEAVPAPDTVRDSLDEELLRLPEQYRSAVVLCYLEGRTQAEAAQLLATTTDAVNSRLKRARDLLRRRLARRGLTLSAAALADRAARAALSPCQVRLVARTALEFTARGMSCGISATAATLATGALHPMRTSAVKLLSALLVILVVSLAAAGTFLAPPAEPARKSTPPSKLAPPRAAPKAKTPRQPSIILLWMEGGPSQIDTWDPKPKHPNGGLFAAIDTNVKGVQISSTLPRLAKQMNHLALIRSLQSREGDHFRGAYRMRTGYTAGGDDYPELGCVLAKELGDSRPQLPRYIRFGRPILGRPPADTPGFLGRKYAPLVIGREEKLALPDDKEFEKIDKERGKAQRQAVKKAFDLKEEKAAVHAAYGRGRFGQACLLARRLVERGVPVVEVMLGGWDTHANVLGTLPKLTDQLDAGMSALLKDLAERKLLDSTLIVWMGEFGRTPVINKNGGRDHWPNGFTVVLAGRGIKGGQVVGRTSADGMTIEARPVSPAELHASIYKALGIDPAKENRDSKGRKIPLVERGTQPVKEALR